MKATSSIYHDTRRAKAGDTFPLKLRITFLRKRKYYGIGIDVTISEWVRINSPKPRGKLKEIKAKTNQLLEKADSIIKTLEAFSFPAFERHYMNPNSKSLDLKVSFQAYIDSIFKQGRIGTAESYQTAMRSILEYKKHLRLSDITPEFLCNYEKWMLDRKKSMTTIGIYLRSLRTILNIAIEEGLIKRDQYPFGKRKFQIPTGHNIKKSLSFMDIAKLYNYKTPLGSAKDKARDFWFFSYLANGMNFKDICRLKYSNIHNDTLVFFRAKTERTKRSNLIPIVAIITEDMKRIIHKWGNVDRNVDAYVFPVISKGLCPQRERALTMQFTKVTNKWLKRIGKEIDITSKITTYSARHSFSTILKNDGATIQYIKESLGHHSTQTTENYLGSYPDDVKRQFSNKLTAFIDTSGY